MTLQQALFAVLTAWPAHVTDTEDPSARLARLTIVSMAVDDASAHATCSNSWAGESCRPIWRGSRRELASAVLALGHFESRYAQYVGEGRCHEGPKGARCDNGNARTYWQTWQVACPAAWEAAPGSEAEVRAGAWCATRLMAAAVTFCTDRGTPTNWAGGFGRYAARTCGWSGGVERARGMQAVLVGLSLAR